MFDMENKNGKKNKKDERSDAFSDSCRDCERNAGNLSEKRKWENLLLAVCFGYSNRVSSVILAVEVKENERIIIK